MALYFIAPTADMPAHFLDDAIHGAIPSGAVRITPAVFQRMLAARSEGRAILAGLDGKPKVGPKPVETLAELRMRKIRQVKSEAARRIDAFAPTWKQLNDIALLALGDAEEGKELAVARRNTISDIRAASDALEFLIVGMDLVQLSGIDPHASAHWPNAST